MKKEMKQVLWVVALFVILMTATGNLVSAAGFDWSDDTFGNACKKVYSVSFRSGGGASSAIYKKLEKKQKYGSMITIPKVPQVPAGYQAEGWSLKKGGAEARYKPGKKYFVKRNVTFYAVIKKKNNPKLILHRNDGDIYKIIQAPSGKLKLPVMANEENYTFLGWSTRAGQKTAPRYEAGQVITVSGTMHLYAVRFWRYQEPNLVRNSFHYPENYERIIFVGDSRTEGIRDAVGDDSVWSCLSGKGYDWMVQTGVPQIEDEIEKNTAIIFLMGVNDPFNVNNYINYINEKAYEWAAIGAQTYFVSVGPVEKDPYITNAQIESFNTSMENNLSGVKYIDVYTHLVENGYATVDGLHYPANVSIEIYNYILENLEEVRSGIWG